MSPAGWRRLDRVVVVFCRGSAIAAASVVVLVVVFLIVESGPALSAIGLSRFALDGSWNPTPDGAVGRFGLLPMVFGSLAVTAGALAMAVPLGLGVALFAREMAPRAVGRAARRVLALLAGVPSVVYGLWGLVTLVPLIGRIEPPGPSLLAGAVVLGLMILPTVALLADAALAEVPTEHRRAAAALGLSKTATVFGVLLPAARGGIVTGILLARPRRDDGCIDGVRKCRAGTVEPLRPGAHAHRQHRARDGLRAR